MTYTTQQLQAMSDFEVNKALAKKVMLDFKLETWTFDNNKDTVQFFNEETKKSRVVNYCNNPNDIMPLGFERRIQIMPFQDKEGTEWIADQIFNDSFESAYSDKNPLRAIACLILMMEE